MTPGNRRLAELNLSAGIYAALLEQLPEGVVVADGHGRLVLANHRADRLTGLPLTDSLGQDICRALPLTGAGGRSFWASQDPWHGLHTRSGSPETRLLTPGGRTVLVSTRHIRGKAPRRRLQWLVMTMRSTTVRDRIETETAALVTTVAHELRSPLGAVRGFSRTLRTRWKVLRDEQKLWMLDAIDSDAGRLQRMVDELLDISRIETGRMQLRRHPVVVMDLVRTCVGTMISAGADPSRFRLVGPDDSAEVFADADRLQQIVTNLLDNALHHGAGRITVTVGRAGDQLLLDVADEGPGIPPEHRGLVFSRFWQGERRPGGTGLGLFVVQALAQAHGGRVEVLDTPIGATFRLSLPADLPEHLR